jgi:peptidoglycan/LPS O-acetylase OafA/YrhL
MPQQTYLPSKPRYEILDGLRGVAALVVLAYHHFEIYSTGHPTGNPVSHGYLAVDFFFILSGFVIGYAYDDRWDRMSLGAFAWRRIVRLHPLIVLSTVMGAVLFYYGMSTYFPLIGQSTPAQVLLLMLLGCLMVPVTPAMDIRGWNEQYPLNGNAWSLLFEYVANVMYALVIRHFPRWLLALFVAVSALLTLNLTLDINVFGLVERCPAEVCTVIGGWTLEGPQMFIGLTRLLYPFFAGLLLSRLMTDRLAPLCRRLGEHGFARRGFWLCSMVMLVVLLMPWLSDVPMVNGIYEAVCILVVFPLVVVLGGSCHVTGRSARLCKWLGDISYPLYIMQYAIVFGLQGAWSALHPDATVEQTVFSNVCTFVLSIVVAWASLKLFDEPVRRWLRGVWDKKSK